MAEESIRESNRRTALVAEGKFKQAIASLDESLRKDPRDERLYRERGHLHLYFNQPQQARSDFDNAARLGTPGVPAPTGRLHTDIYYNAIGVTYWMEGHKELALAFWRYTTTMLDAGRVSYSHSGGGIEAGLLLWFGAVHLRSPDDIALVRKFYENRLASTSLSHDLKSWPGPIVRFFLEAIGEEDLLKSARNPHDLCEAHFALAIRARAARRHVAYQKHIKLAAPRKSASEVYDFYNVWPYFLAWYEVATFPKHRQ